MALPVYMLLGPEEGRKKEFIEKLKASLGGCEISRFYGFDEYEDELYAQLMNTDLFCAYRLVILDSAEEIKRKDKTAPLAEYIRNPSENVTLVLMSKELYIDSDLMKAMPEPKESIVKFYEMFENQKEQWVREYFRSNGFSIDDDAVGTIIERVENNINEFSNVCSQICIYMGTLGDKKSIGYGDIEDFLSHTRQETEFSLFAHIAGGRTDSALECLHSILNTSDYFQLSLIAVYFRKVYSIHKNMQKGMDIEEALKAKFYENDRPVVMPRDKSIYKEACRRYSLRNVCRILTMLAEYDIAVKEAGTALAPTVLERCVVRIIRFKGAPKEEFQYIIPSGGMSYESC